MPMQVLILRFSASLASLGPIDFKFRNIFTEPTKSLRRCYNRRFTLCPEGQFRAIAELYWV